MSASTTPNRGGRPPKAGGPMSQAERNARREAKLQRAGGRLLHVALQGPEAAALDAIVKRDGHQTDRDAIGAALLALARRRVQVPR